MKKEKQKALSQVDLEKLSKDDPELFEKQLEKAEKMRAMVGRAKLEKPKLMVFRRVV